MSDFSLWSRTTIGLVLALIITTAIILYIVFQARFLLIGPQLVLLEELPAVTNERFVTIVGQATNITSITLNGRPIFTDEDGYFSEEMMLENGYTIATVAATDRFGRTTDIVREFMYLPASVAPSTTEAITN